MPTTFIRSLALPTTPLKGAAAAAASIPKLYTAPHTPVKDAGSRSWSSIFSQLDNDASKPNLPLYVHPLVKKLATSMSQKSLELCTEPLGSETGSDGFQEEDHPRRKHTHPTPPRKVAHQRSFPPPLPSLGGGSSVHMRRSHHDGRLVLEAVSVPSQSRFRAERHAGRLLLTFSDHRDQPKIADEEEEKSVGKDKICRVPAAVEVAERVIPLLVRGCSLPCRRPLVLIMEASCIVTT